MWFLERKIAKYAKKRFGLNSPVVKPMRKISSWLSRCVAGLLWVRRNTRLSEGALPDFVIVGAQKAGTTSLYYYLTQHPDIIPAWRKEMHFFDQDYSHGLDWYRSFFPSEKQLGRPGSIKITGEASPDYMFYPFTAARIKKAVPDAKVIAILRNPVDRAYSHYSMEINTGREDCKTFEDAIAREPERLEGEKEKVTKDGGTVCYSYRHLSYIERGKYAEQLKPYLEQFGKDKLLVVKGEDLYEKTDETVNKVFAFLGLPLFTLKDSENIQKGAYTSRVSDKTRKQLESEFKPEIERLRDLTSQDIRWW